MYQYFKCDKCDHLADVEIRFRPKRWWRFDSDDGKTYFCEAHFVEWARGAIIRFNKEHRI